MRAKTPKFPSTAPRVSRQTCEARIADAKTIGWKALEQSWQRDLDRIEALERAPGPLVGVLHKPNTGKD